MEDGRGAGVGADSFRNIFHSLDLFYREALKIKGFKFMAGVFVPPSVPSSPIEELPAKP